MKPKPWFKILSHPIKKKKKKKKKKRKNEKSALLTFAQHLIFEAKSGYFYFLWVTLDCFTFWKNQYIIFVCIHLKTLDY